MCGCGSEVVVFGNGGSRRVKEGMKADQVKHQLIQILQTVHPLARRYGVRIALEPLCTKETNMVTSFMEAAEMAVAGGENIGAVCDLYHVITDKQAPKETLGCPEKEKKYSVKI